MTANVIAHHGNIVAARDKTDLAISFSAGRRGVGNIDCITCGEQIHQHAINDPEAAWYGGDGLHRGLSPRLHDHAPAHEIGPTFGPFDYVDITYQSIRVTEGDTLAVWDDRRGDWILTGLAGQYEGQAYSDATVFARAGA